MKTLLALIKNTFKISKLFFVLMFLSIILQVASTMLLVYTPSIVIGVIEKGKEFNEILRLALAIVGLNALVQLVSSFINKRLDACRDGVSQSFDILMADKVLSLDYEMLEDPSILDLKERAIFSVKNQGAFYGVLTSLVSIINCLVTMITLVSIIVQLSIVVVIMILAYLIVYILISIKIYFSQVKLFNNIVPINRKFSYYVETLTSVSNAKDFRIYKADDLVLSNLASFQDELGKEFVHVYKTQGAYNSLIESVKGILQGGIYLYIARSLYKGLIKSSSFALYTSSALSFVTQTAALVSSFAELSRSISYSIPFMQMLNLPTKVKNTNKKHLEGTIETIEFKNVSFTYPRQNHEVLSNISFKINKGELISIVGLNGAGKTTIIKLICRLYEPTSGEILINGVNIKDYDLESYNRHIACVFQDYKLLGYSIRDNIAFDGKMPDKAYEILTSLGMKERIDTLPKGIDTMLNKQLEEDATNFSGGQEQKIAIARALYKDADFIMLDEPTSALDPKSEADIYENFNHLTNGKTAIYVSHRMSSSTFCDKILVIDGGKVAAFDSHQNLMKQDTLYRKLFLTQAKNYQN